MAKDPIIRLADVLDRFHNEFEDKSIETNLVQVPEAENGDVAIVKAVVKGTKGGYRYHFEGVGDADPTNVNDNIKPHIIRMAESRAKARALKDITNAKGTLAEDAHPDGSAAVEGASEKHGGAQPRIGKSRLDLLTALAQKLRGDDGPDLLAQRIGRPLEQLTPREGEEWIERLTDGEPR